jgi:hypothetical protein
VEESKPTKVFDDEDWQDDMDGQSKLKEALRAILRVL